MYFLNLGVKGLGIFCCYVKEWGLFNCYGRRPLMEDVKLQFRIVYVKGSGKSSGFSVKRNDSRWGWHSTDRELKASVRSFISLES